MSFFTAYVDSNHGWFILNLLFEKVVIDWLVVNGTRSGNDDDNNDDDNDKSIERVFEVEKLEYGKEK